MSSTTSAKNIPTYPDSHPQSKSNPQESWCYPLAALGRYREWLQDTYIEGGKFSAYLKVKVVKVVIITLTQQTAYRILAPSRARTTDAQGQRTQQQDLS